MKVDDHAQVDRDTRSPHTARRRLMFALPGTVMLGSLPVLVSCGGGGGAATTGSTGSPSPSPSPSPVEGVTLTPAVTDLLAGGTTTLSAAASAPEGATLVYHWTVGGDPAAVIAESPAVPGNQSGLSFDSSDNKVDVVTASSTVGDLTVTVEAFAVVGSTRTSLGRTSSLVRINRSKVAVIAPAEATVKPDGGTAPLVFVPAAPITPPTGKQVQFEWSCPSLYGKLSYGSTETSPSSTSFIVTSPIVNYTSNASGLVGGEVDKVTCTAFYVLTTGDRADQAAATGEVTVLQKFNISLSPDSGDVPTDFDFPVTASIQEPLPPGTTVVWSWIGGGVGTITAEGGDANSGVSRVFLRSSVEGAAIATVSADVRPPGGPTTPVVARTATLNMKKGLKQIVLRPPFGVYSYADSAGNTSLYGAYVVPNLPTATGYSAKFDFFTYGPCNTTRSWTTTLPDRGGCDFPVTYFPFGGSSTKSWAVWMGFGNPAPDPTGQVVVTITLA